MSFQLRVCASNNVGNASSNIPNQQIVQNQLPAVIVGTGPSPANHPSFHQPTILPPSFPIQYWLVNMMKQNCRLYLREYGDFDEVWADWGISYAVFAYPREAAVRAQCSINVANLSADDMWITAVFPYFAGDLQSRFLRHNPNWSQLIFNNTAMSADTFWHLNCELCEYMEQHW